MSFAENDESQIGDEERLQDNVFQLGHWDDSEVQCSEGGPVIKREVIHDMRGHCSAQTTALPLSDTKFIPQGRRKHELWIFKPGYE